MKPIVTWVILLTAREAHVVVNTGPGKGLFVLEDKTWSAEPATGYSSEAGIGHSIAGPGVSAVDQGDPQGHADQTFAKEIAEDLEAALARKQFDRLVIASGPHMLGVMRKALTRSVQGVLVAEIPKDLSALPLDSLQTHLDEIIAT
ncbi:MAG: host attachment protein [Roseovarius sp.]|jgi:hypothetical protein|nr:host attachment protein [Roseovarius sp.]